MAHTAANSRLTPGSLKRLAMVGIDRQLLVRHAGALGMIAAPLLAHVAQAVGRAALLALVEHDEVGVVEHVDLLELAGGAVLAGHDVQRQIHQVDDLGVGLADAGGLDDHQVEAGGLVQLDHVLEHRRGRQRARAAWRASA